MKKIFTGLLAAVCLCLSVILVGCGNDTPVDKTTGAPTPTVDTPTETPTIEPTLEPTVEPTPRPYIPDEIIDGWQGEDDKIKARGTGVENAVLVFHYQRDKEDYENWGMWLWVNNGVRREVANRDTFGVYYKIDLGDSSMDYYHAKTINYIYFKSEDGTWDNSEKDKYSADRQIDLDESMLTKDNEIHFYSFEGVETVYLSKDKTEPVCVIRSSSLNAKGETITTKTNAPVTSYKVYNNNELVAEETLSKPKSSFKYYLDSFDMRNDSYSIEVTFKSGVVKTIDVNINSLFDSLMFDETYVYDGDDLGVKLEGKNTLFKIWAPLSKKVTVNLYNYGHPESLGTAQYPGDDKPAKSFDLEYTEYGVWSKNVAENLEGYYYTYTIVNGTKINENVVDPYAKAVGVNGLRGYIVDFSKTNPEGWSYNYKRPYSVTELIVYETHVRDLTMDKTWNGTEKNRGTYLGMCEEGTTYTKDGVTVTTGFDHIKELGINAIQILPFFDHANDELANEFNWGYNPQNYNALEGEYSTNPYDAATRIKEFKTMVKAYQDAGIEVIMDVVYNHMNGISGSSFDKIVPGYFFRYEDNGNPSSGSGCGNDTASERPMYSKFMVDSVKFWVTEYNLSGFRFDLMGLHDVDTMNKISNALHAIDKNIVVYGEPWEMGTATQRDVQLANYNIKNYPSLQNIGMFCDVVRNGIVVGSAFGDGAESKGGWVQNYIAEDFALKGLQGLTYDSPTRQINYVSCHDNYTVHDKLVLSGTKEENLSIAAILSQGMVFTAQGMSFMLNGEEFLRSKVLIDEEGNIETDENGKVKFSGNSYNLPDRINAIRWNEKIDNIETYNKIKELIKLNRSHGLFHIASADLATTAVKNEYHSNNVIINNISRINGVNDGWSKVKVIYANSKGSTDKTLKGSYSLTEEWKVAFASGNTTLNAGDTVSGSIQVGDYTMIVLYQY